MLGLPDEFWLALLRPVIALAFLGLLVYPLAALVERLLAYFRRKYAARGGAPGLSEHPKRIHTTRLK